LLLSGYKSDKGLLRENNEDSYFVNDKVGGYVVADGMGGYKGGEIASNIAVNTLGKILSDSLQKKHEKDIQHIVHKALQKANDEIILTRRRHNELTNMATTVVLSIFFNDVLYYSHLGDSRAYLYKKEGKLIQLTTDDSLVMEMVKRGVINEDELRTHNLRNIVTKYLGLTDLELPEVLNCYVGIEDCIILCSDGLTSMLEEKEILSIVKRDISMGPQIICDTLVDKANNNGGYDNITIIVVQNK
jgi:serine/threonine protein phosphatase PrpC